MSRPNARVDVVIDASSGRDNLLSASVHPSINPPFNAFITLLLCDTRLPLLSAAAASVHCCRPTQHSACRSSIIQLRKGLI